MKKGFYTIMAAQFFSSLADNALFIAAIAMLLLLDGPAWLTPLLKWFNWVHFFFHDFFLKRRGDVPLYYALLAQIVLIACSGASTPCSM